jgi:CDP-glycerol glycerophosphotransferase (TagB/SpsB family)
MRSFNDTPIRVLEGVRQVFIGHGESDKAASAHKLYRSFDRFCIPGQAGIDRFKQRGIAVRNDFFVTVGRPQLAGLETARQQGKISQEIRTVLYAPTWYGYLTDDHHSSLRRGTEIVRGLLAQGWTVIFRPHPLSTVANPLQTPVDDRQYVQAIDQALAQDQRSSGREHLGSKASLELSADQCINRSDGLISDVSSMVVDYLITDKPIAVNSNYDTLDDFYREKPNFRDLYVIEKDLTNLNQVLNSLNSDPQSAERLKLKVYLLGAAEPRAQVPYFLAKFEPLLE